MDSESYLLKSPFIPQDEQDRVRAMLVVPGNMKASWPRIFRDHEPVYSTRTRPDSSKGWYEGEGVTITEVDGKFYYCEIVEGSCEGCDVWQQSDERFFNRVFKRLLVFKTLELAVSFSKRHAAGLRIRLEYKIGYTKEDFAGIRTNDDFRSLDEYW